MKKESLAYPTEWEDDQIMDVLFAPFRQSRQLNEVSYDKKMKFWSALIVNVCKQKKTVVLHKENLASTFLRKGKRPACLDKVVDSMLRDGDLMYKSQFENQNQGWVSWGMNVFVKAPIKWTVGSIVGWGKQSETIFVMQELVKEKSQEMLECHYKDCEGSGWSENTVEWKEFRDKCTDICADDESFNLTLSYLCISKKAAIIETNGTKLIRFATVESPLESPIMQSEVDIKLLQIKKTECKLTQETVQIGEDIERCLKEAKQYVRQGKKPLAKKCLREKQLLTQRLEQKERSMHTLVNLRQQLIDAESNKQVLDAYNAGTSAFKDVTKLYGLDSDKVDEVMSDVQEMADVAADINASIAQPTVEDADLDISVAELEAELDDLLASDVPTAQPDEPQPYEPSTTSTAAASKDDRTQLPPHSDISLDDLLDDLPEVPTREPGSAAAGGKAKPLTTELSKIRQELYAT